MLQEFKKAFERIDIVITTCGLSPTFDYITVETVAEYLNPDMYLDRTYWNLYKE